VTAEGEAYLRVGGGLSSTRHLHTADGDRVPIEGGRRLREAGVSGYFALGVAPDVELSVSVAGKEVSLSGPPERESATGLGDLRAALKLGLGGQDVVRSVQLALKVPTGYDEGDEPPLGDGQLDAEGRVLAGASLWKLGIPGYVGLEAGYRHRVMAPSDEIVFLLEAGTAVFRDVGLRMKLDGDYARELPVAGSPRSDLFALNKRQLRLEGVLWFSPARDLFVEVGRVFLLDAANVAAGEMWTIGVASVLRAD
jgi:hypothetical protein